MGSRASAAARRKTRRIDDLTAAAVLPDRRAERRRRLAGPDLEFRAYQRGEISQRPGCTGNLFRAG
jgi:hypothetical protein